MSTMTSRAADTGDRYGDPKLGWFLILLILAAVAIVTFYAWIYFRVEYGFLSWGAQAYPSSLRVH